MHSLKAYLLSSSIRWACSCNVCDASCCCYFSNHALLSLRHESHAVKTTTAKKLAQEEDISVQKGSLMLMPSWMNVHDGNLMDYTTSSLYTGCSHTLWPLGGKNIIEPSSGASDSPCLSETLGGRANCHGTHWPWVNQRRDTKGIQ